MFCFSGLSMRAPGQRIVGFPPGRAVGSAAETRSQSLPLDRDAPPGSAGSPSQLKLQPSVARLGRGNYVAAEAAGRADVGAPQRLSYFAKKTPSPRGSLQGKIAELCHASLFP